MLTAMASVMKCAEQFKVLSRFCPGTHTLFANSRVILFEERQVNPVLEREFDMCMMTLHLTLAFRDIPVPVLHRKITIVRTVSSALFLVRAKVGIVRIRLP